MEPVLLSSQSLPDPAEALDAVQGGPGPLFFVGQAGCASWGQDSGLGWGQLIAGEELTPSSGKFYRYWLNLPLSKSFSPKTR